MLFQSATFSLSPDSQIHPHFYHQVLCGRGCSHLGVLKHAQVGVHAQGFLLVAGALVDFCRLVEFALIGEDVCQEQLVVTLAPLLPLLRKKNKKK